MGKTFTIGFSGSVKSSLLTPPSFHKTSPELAVVVSLFEYLKITVGWSLFRALLANSVESVPKGAFLSLFISLVKLVLTALLAKPDEGFAPLPLPKLAPEEKLARLANDEVPFTSN